MGTSAVHDTVQPGALLLGKYRVDRKLGSGGMGFVVAATHVDLHEKVAIKVLHTAAMANPEARARFLREAQAIVKLKSEHVVRVRDVGVLEDGSPYMIMEYLDGADLQHLARATGTLDSRIAADYVMQVCEALAEAHSHGLVHRDIKPSNIFVSMRADGSPLVKVLDFGISKAAGDDISLTRTDSTLGTPAYMSPEQMRSARRVDTRSDLWSLGIVLYELLEGSRPWEAEAFSEMIFKVATEPPDPMRRADPGMQSVVARCLQKDPATRFGSVAELAAALAPFATNPHEAWPRVERIGRILARGWQRADLTPLPGSTTSAQTAPAAYVGTRPVSAAYTEPSPVTHHPPRRRLVWVIGVLAGVLAGTLMFVLVRPEQAVNPTPAVDAAVQATAHVTPDAATLVDAAPAPALEPTIDAGAAVVTEKPQIKKPPRPRKPPPSPPAAGSADTGSAAWTNRK